ncbi:uncharacterized protein LOC107360629 [Tetranychus urticae]|uniref:uncharacterized protein LOC107360629 n=1 Tax=Tetranychus urticae TaxID=32264 RepID=UPI00077C09C1|nr:uncharacterized protein LOC107360629 [Tetranychus urticae]
MIRGIAGSKGFNSDDDTRFCLSDNEIGLSSPNGLNFDSLPSRVSLTQRLAYPYQFKNSITSPVNGLNSTVSQQQLISVDYDDICTESEVLSVASTSARVRKPRKIKLNQGSGQINNGDLPVSINGSGSRLANSNWINLIFEQAKSGNLPLLKQNLQGITTCLISNLCDEKGNTLWHVTARYNHMPCLRWLCFLPDGQEPLLIRNYQNLLPVESAIKNGSFEVVQWLIKATVVNKMVLESEPGERTLLHFTAKCGQEEILNWLVGFMIFNGVDINQRDMQGNTALHFAAKFNQTSSFKILVMNNGDLKARNKMRLRPIDIAKMNGFKDCVNYLAALEACLSLAEENIALETELLHYGAEFTELEKCFSELLQLSKSDKVQMQGYFGSVVESIERKWKRCKAKSIGIRGVAKQSPLDVFQSHFSRVLTNGGLADRHISNQPIGNTRNSRENILLHNQSSYNQTSHHINNQLNQHRFYNSHLNNSDNIVTTDSNGYTHTYSDPFVKLNNSHYAVSSSVDADYAVPCKTRTSKCKNGMNKNDEARGEDHRGLKQRGQPEGSSVSSVYPQSSSIYESFKRPSVENGADDFGVIDVDEDDDDELSGYSSLKLRPEIHTASGNKDCLPSNRTIDGSPSDHSHQTKSPETTTSDERGSKVDEEADDESESKSSPSRSSLGSKESRGSIGNTELSEVESKISESSMIGSVSMKENDSGVGEMDSNSGSRKRGFLHKFSLRKWTSSSPSKPKKSYSKETLLRSNVSNENLNGVNEISSKTLKSGVKSGNNDWWPGDSSHEIHGKDTNGHNDSSEPLMEPQSDKQLSSSNNYVTINNSTSSTKEETDFPSSSKQNSSSGSSANNYFKNNEIKDNPYQPKVSCKNADKSKASLNTVKLNYSRLKDDKIRSVSMEALDVYPATESQLTLNNSLPGANDVHKSANHISFDNSKIKISSILKGSKLAAESISKTDKNVDNLEVNDRQSHYNQHQIASTQAISTTSVSLVSYESPVTLTSAQSVPILSNSVYGVKHVKKAKIKELSPLTYDEPLSLPSTSTSNPSSPKFIESRKKMFEKGPGNKNARGFRRRRNGSRAWYDVSDDEDGLVSQKINRDTVNEEQELVE